MKNPALFPILLIVFVDVLGFAVVIPLLPFHAQALGATPATVGMLIATYAACALFAGPLLGRASDRWGRKPVLIVSQLGSLGGFVMLALAPSLTWLFLGRALDGCTAGNLLVARACISDVTPPKERSAAFGLIAAAFGFGYLVGPASAALLAGYGTHAPLWLAAALSATSLLSTLFLLPSRSPSVSLEPSATMRTLFAAPGVVPQLAQWFAFIATFGLFTSGFALFCERRMSWDGRPFGPVEVGYLLAWIGALGLFVQLFLLRRLIERIGETRLVSLALALAALGYAGLAVAQSVPVLLATLALSGIGSSLLRPALLGLLSQAVPMSRQGLMSGLTQSLQSLAMIVAPLTAGAMIHHGWLTGWALACATMLVLALRLAPRALRSAA